MFSYQENVQMLIERERKNGTPLDCGVSRMYERDLSADEAIVINAEEKEKAREIVAEYFKMVPCLEECQYMTVLISTEIQMEHTVGISRGLLSYVRKMLCNELPKAERLGDYFVNVGILYDDSMKEVDRFVVLVRAYL